MLRTKSSDGSRHCAPRKACGPSNPSAHSKKCSTALRGVPPAAEEPKPALDLALAQLEVVRGDFRNAIAGLTKLGDLLKQAHRESKASDKEISSVRATLRSLQSVRI